MVSVILIEKLDYILEKMKSLRTNYSQAFLAALRNLKLRLKVSAFIKQWIS